jgi:hypothetical protein
MSPTVTDERQLFIDTYVALLERVDDYYRAIITDEGEKHRTSPRPLIEAIALMVLQHIQQGFPLELPAVVIEAYLAGETETHECGDCGYGCPRSFEACPLCGGRTGPNAYALRRARVAQNN